MLNYKKPAFWIVVVAIIAAIVTAVCFLTNPKTIGDSITLVDSLHPEMVILLPMILPLVKV